LHFALGFVLYLFRPGLPTVYAFAVAVAGLYVIAGKDPRRLAFVLIYIAGAEIAWRMTKADVFWEFGKYLTVGLILLSILRWRLHLSALALMYFALLLPSIFLTLNWLSASLAQDAVSFNLSGPLALAFCAIYFQNIKLDKNTITRLLLVGVLPILSVSALTLRGLLASEQIVFSLNSNFATSGGYGPNQVSAILGLGALFCILYMFIARPTGFSGLIMLGMTLLFVVQSILTFSRGGVYNIIVALPLALFYLMRRRLSSRQRAPLFLLVFLAMLSFLVIDINAFTGGALFERFRDLNSTGRLELFLIDVQIWLQNPWLGVGVGVSPIYHPLFGGIESAAHTEYSRILAEHGILGIGSLLILGLLCVRAFFRSRSNPARGFLAGMSLWSLAEMAHSAMRIVAIPIVFALPLAILDYFEQAPQDNSQSK
jgi:O-antigen ligase